MESNLSLSIDLSAFHNGSEPDKNCKDFEKCISVKRLISALSYYSSLNVSKNKDDQNIFINFIKEIYSVQILDDYQHLHKLHDDHLQDIVKWIKSNSTKFEMCDLSDCHFSDRKYRVNRNDFDGMDVSDHDLCFYVEIMDNIHFHLFHLYDTNLRMIRNETVNVITKDNYDEKDVENPYFDKRLANHLKILSNGRESSARFARINDNQSKFTIKADNQYDGDDNNSTVTVLDLIYTQLSMKPQDIDQESIKNLSEYVKNQQFDTESMHLDFQLNKMNGNIVQSVSTECAHALSAIFKSYQSMFQSACFVYNIFGYCVFFI